MPLISAEHEPHLPALQFQRHGQVGGLRRLDLVDGVEDDHALADLGGVVLELAAVGVAAPDAERGLGHSRILCPSDALAPIGRSCGPIELHDLLQLFRQLPAALGLDRFLQLLRHRRDRLQPDLHRRRPGRGR